MNRYDLEDRLINCSVNILDIAEDVESTFVGNILPTNSQDQALLPC